jgi:hypothetical protein
MPNPEDRRAYKAEHRAKQRLAGFRRMTITLDASEVTRLAASAKRHGGARLTSHLKACAISGLDARYLVPPDVTERLDALVAILRGVGNNLNQMARHSNEMKAFVDSREAHLQLRRIENEVRAFLTNPPRSGEPSNPP